MLHGHFLVQANILPIGASDRRRWNALILNFINSLVFQLFPAWPPGVYEL
jgi:hypothetical protein